MEIESRYMFTPGTQRPTIAMTGVNWPSPTLETTPIAGDFICFSATDSAPMYQVRNRLFIWERVDRLVLQLLLGPGLTDSVDQH
jgi:hypothetical protein